MTENEVEQAEDEKLSRRPMDPILRQTAALDRLLSEMPDGMRKWALAFLWEKYLGTDPKA